MNATNEGGYPNIVENWLAFENQEAIDKLKVAISNPYDIILYDETFRIHDNEGNSDSSEIYQRILVNYVLEVKSKFSADKITTTTLE